MDVLRIVVIDDSDQIRRAIVVLLENAGHEIVGQAAGGGSGGDEALARRPDLVVIDWRMPDVDGRRGHARDPGRPPERRGHRVLLHGGPRTYGRPSRRPAPKRASTSATSRGCWPPCARSRRRVPILVDRTPPGATAVRQGPHARPRVTAVASPDPPTAGHGDERRPVVTGSLGAAPGG